MARTLQQAYYQEVVGGAAPRGGTIPTKLRVLVAFGTAPGAHYGIVALWWGSAAAAAAAAALSRFNLFGFWC